MTTRVNLLLYDNHTIQWLLGLIYLLTITSYPMAIRDYLILEKKTSYPMVIRDYLILENKFLSHGCFDQFTSC